MIDNSSGMGQEQDVLRRKFPALLDALKQLPGGLPDLHVAIISSDVGAGNQAIPGAASCNAAGGDRGIFQAKPDCGLNEGAPFVRSYDNGTQNNFTRSLEEVFSCLAKLGVEGCGWEHQLESMRLALSPTLTPSNAGFLRPAAHLAVVMLTDEDDCSAPADSDLFVDSSFDARLAGSFRCNVEGHICNGMPIPQSEFSAPLQSCVPSEDGRLINVKEYSDFLKRLKPDPARVTVSIITGVPATPQGARYSVKKFQTADSDVIDVDAICSSEVGAAAPALRLKAFAESLGSNGTIDSICTGDLTLALTRIGNLVADRMKTALSCQP